MSRATEAPYLPDNIKRIAITRVRLTKDAIFEATTRFQRFQAQAFCTEPVMKPRKQS